MHFVGERMPARRGIHDVEQNLDLLRAFGVEPDAPEAPIFPLDDVDREKAATRLSESGISPDARPIVVHAGSAQTMLARAKRWPSESYSTLVRELSGELGERVVLIEGPDERGVAREIPGARVLELRGPLSESAALLERAEIYVGSDSGLAHLAAAVGTPAVTIFAPADPDRVCPYGYRDLVVQPPTPCTPCFQYPWNAPHPKMLCREPMCITKVTVEMVMEKVRLALKKDSPLFGGVEARP
jgi:ADP-heptose:LPS heptosyltransferase